MLLVLLIVLQRLREPLILNMLSLLNQMSYRLHKTFIPGHPQVSVVALPLINRKKYRMTHRMSSILWSLLLKLSKKVSCPPFLTILLVLKILDVQVVRSQPLKLKRRMKKTELGCSSRLYGRDRNCAEMLKGSYVQVIMILNLVIQQSMKNCQRVRSLRLLKETVSLCWNPRTEDCYETIILLDNMLLLIMHLRKWVTRAQQIVRWSQ